MLNRKTAINPCVAGLACGYAQHEADKLLEAYGLQAPKIPLESLAEAEGATITYNPSASNGSIEMQDGKYIININPTHDSRRQRFTLAHEIGHIVYDKMRNQLTSTIRYRADKGGRASVLEERFCNAFASRLLIPSVALEELKDWRYLSFARVEEVANWLKVSPMALIYRLLEEDERTCGLLWLKQVSKPSDERDVRLRVWQGFFPSGEVFIPRYKSIPEGSILHNAWERGTESRWLNVDLAFCGISEPRIVISSCYPKPERGVQPRSMMLIVYPYQFKPNRLSRDQLTMSESGTKMPDAS